MNKYYIRHKIEIGEVVHLSDRDSEIIIKRKTQKEEDFVEIQTDQELFLGQIAYIDNSTVEVEIMKSLGKIELTKPEDKKELILLISLCTPRKFNLLIEKATELGVDIIIPVVSELSNIPFTEAKKNYTKWTQIIDSARQQSRNPFPPEIKKPVSLENLYDNSYTKEISDYKNYKKLCFTSEIMNKGDFSRSANKPGKYILAIGPEKGWSHKDLEILKKLGFTFVQIGKNILKVETAAISAISIIRYLNNHF